MQGFGKFRIHPAKMNIDLLSVSAHKIHGPKGVGFLYIRSGSRVNPIIYGGGQQKGMRSGTENVPGIAGLARAAELVYADLDRDVDRMYGLREMLIDGVSRIEDGRLISSAFPCAACAAKSCCMHWRKGRSMSPQAAHVPPTNRRYRIR